MQRLVRLAFSNQLHKIGIMTERLNQLFVSNEGDAALQPLTMAIGLPPERHYETMFSWKGFIYYKWRLDDVMKSLPVVLAQLNSIRVYDASFNERAEVERLAETIFFGIDDALRRVRAVFERNESRGDSHGQ